MSLAESMKHPDVAPQSKAGEHTVPCSLLRNGEFGAVARISGNEEVRKFLSGLGFVQGTRLKVLINNSTGLIIDVKGSRVAVDQKMAAKIHVTQ